jgi:hypothetical protein
MSMEEVADYVCSPPLAPMKLAQPPKAGTNYEPASQNLSPKMNQTKSWTTNNSHVSETIRSKSIAPGLMSTWTTSHSFWRGNAPG